MKENKLIKVRMVDDDKEDIELILEVLRLAKPKIDICSVYDGIEAVNNFWFTVVKFPE